MWPVQWSVQRRSNGPNNPISWVMSVPISPRKRQFPVKTANGPYLDGSHPHHVRTTTEEAPTYNPLGLFIFYQSKDELLKPGPDIEDFRHRRRRHNFRDLTPLPPDTPRASTGEDRKATTQPRLA